MPAMDTTISQKKHISDRNRDNPTHTLCGRKLEDVPFFCYEENFIRADCKVCKNLYYSLPLEPASGY